MCDQAFLENPRWSRRCVLGRPVTEKGSWPRDGKGRNGAFRAVTSPGAAAVGLTLGSSAQPLGSQGSCREKNCWASLT